MNDTSSDEILLLKQRLAEQEALNRTLLEKLNEREREIDHLQAQLDKLRRMNFGSRSEKVSRRIAQMEADLNQLQKESDTLTGRVQSRQKRHPPADSSCRLQRCAAGRCLRRVQRAVPRWPDNGSGLLGSHPP